MYSKYIQYLAGYKKISTVHKRRKRTEARKNFNTSQVKKPDRNEKISNTSLIWETSQRERSVSKKL
jgi:hypothetical protein